MKKASFRFCGKVMLNRKGIIACVGVEFYPKPEHAKKQQDVNV